MHGGDLTRLPGTLNHSQTGRGPGVLTRIWRVPQSRRPGALNHARSGPHPWYVHPEPCTRLPGRVSFPAHEGFPNRGPCSLSSQEGGPHSRAPRPPLGMEGFASRAVCPQPHKERSPFAGCTPSTAHRGALTRGAHALKNAQTAPCSQGRCPQPRTQWSPPLGCAPLTADRGVPTRGQCTLKHTWRYPHSRAAGLNWAWRGPDTHYVRPGKRTDGSQLAARHPHLHTEGFPPTGRAPSTAHAVVPTRRQCALKHTERVPTHGPRTINRTWMGPQGCRRALDCTPRVPHLWAVHPQLRTECSSPQGYALSTPMKDPLMGHELSTGHREVPTRRPLGRVFSTAHTVVPTRGPCTLNSAGSGPH